MRHTEGVSERGRERSEAVQVSNRHLWNPLHLFITDTADARSTPRRFPPLIPLTILCLRPLPLPHSSSVFLTPPVSSSLLKYGNPGRRLDYMENVVAAHRAHGAHRRHGRTGRARRRLAAEGRFRSAPAVGRGQERPL